MKKYIHGDVCINLFDNGRLVVTPSDSNVKNFPASDFPPFMLKVGCSDAMLFYDDSIKLESVTECKNGVIITYLCDKYGLKVDTKLSFVPNTSVIVQENSVTNFSQGCVKLTRLSSSFIDLVAHDENLPWYENDELFIYICHNKWQGEAQWQKFKPYELGLYPSCTHSWERASFKIGTSGSWSCANYYPLTVIEDKHHGKAWFTETEGAHNWNIKYTNFGGYSEPSLSIESISADAKNGGWYYDLKPGETYTAERAFWGCVDGGFEDATYELIKFKRADSTAGFGTIPVIFNVYMDCIWGTPTPERLLPLIEKAGDMGCEYFVIDGGWCKTERGAEGNGDWIPCDFYKDMPLEKIIEKIKARGMKPGIWTELDSVNDTAYGYGLDKDALLYRDGNVIGGARAFYNMNNTRVREYLKSRIDYLYKSGFRYIKNDYNQSTDIGSENNANGSPAEGNIVNANAFYSFIDEIRSEYPDLVIENCGSGALRDDNKTLKRFEVQSISDQELYLNNVSIVSGSMTLMPPEKNGIWSYPYPAHFDDRDSFSPSEAYIKEMADGRETAYNMVSSMCGVIFLSGRLDCADKYNLELVRRGVEQYKRIREYIPFSRPIYPCGTCRLNEKCNYAFGLLCEKKLLLCVWNVNCDDLHFECDLSKYIKSGKIASEYFADNTLKYAFDGKNLSVDFADKKTAGFFEIDIES